MGETGGSGSTDAAEARYTYLGHVETFKICGCSCLYFSYHLQDGGHTTAVQTIVNTVPTGPATGLLLGSNPTTPIEFCGLVTDPNRTVFHRISRVCHSGASSKCHESFASVDFSRTLPVPVWRLIHEKFFGQDGIQPPYRHRRC